MFKRRALCPGCGLTRYHLIIVILSTKQKKYKDGVCREYEFSCQNGVKDSTVNTSINFMLNFTPPPGYRSPRRQPSVDDETSFSGVSRGDTYDHIPSRAFQKLQSLTGGSEVDRSSIRSNVTGGIFSKFCHFVSCLMNVSQTNNSGDELLSCYCTLFSCNRILDGHFESKFWMQLDLAHVSCNNMPRLKVTKNLN